MKLQYHKIRGVDKSVCTAEQKIAYNMASRIYGDIRFAKAWQQYDSGKVPAFLQNDWESKAIRKYFTTWQRDYNKASAHYNEDAIFSALRAGLHDFICPNAPLSTIRHDTKRTRIPNTYDSGYHFENIPVQERRLKIDF